MKITFQMGVDVPGVAPKVSVELNTICYYTEYISALTMIQGIIAAKIKDFEAELQQQAVAASEENDYQLAC